MRGRGWGGGGIKFVKGGGGEGVNFSGFCLNYYCLKGLFGDRRVFLRVFIFIQILNDRTVFLRTEVTFFFKPG